MTDLVVLSLRYSSWSMRPWLALTHAGIAFNTRTVELPSMQHQVPDNGAAWTDELDFRKQSGSVTGLYPVLWTAGVPIHESLAICEWAAEQHAQLWPEGANARARARAFSCEMLTGFHTVRAELACHLFGRVPDFTPSPRARAELDRAEQLWDECLQASGGPYLFGSFTITDCMYFPMLSRFLTYGVSFSQGSVSTYAGTMLATPAVQALVREARRAPTIPRYDALLRSLRGDPLAALHTGPELARARRRGESA